MMLRLAGRRSGTRGRRTSARWWRWPSASRCSRSRSPSAPRSRRTGHHAGLTAEERAQLSRPGQPVRDHVGRSRCSWRSSSWAAPSASSWPPAGDSSDCSALVGATPRQVRRMVLGESAVVAVLAAAAGCLLGTVATPAFLALLRWRGVVAVDLDAAEPRGSRGRSPPRAGSPWRCSGSWRASKRAARVSPVAAFQEAGVERRRPSLWQLIVGTCAWAARWPRWSWSAGPARSSRW